MKQIIISFGFLIMAALQLHAQSIILTSDIGNNCNEITIDGKLYRFAEQPFSKIVFIPEIKKNKTLFHVQVTGVGRIKLPVAAGKHDAKVKAGRQLILFKAKNDGIELEIDDSISGEWLTVEI
jgi:hypothetical protein